MQTEDSESRSDPVYQQLDANIVVAERIAGTIFLGVLAVVGFVAWLLLSFFLLDGFGWQSWMSGLAFALFLSGLATLFWFDPLWKHRSTHWRETEKGFELKRGYVWWHHIFVPRERIQHTDVVQGPILRRYGMATLVINTAGTHEYSISVEGLPLAQAESLRSSLLPKRNTAVPTSEAVDDSEAQTKLTTVDSPLKIVDETGSIESKDAASPADSEGIPSNDGNENERI